MRLFCQSMLPNSESESSADEQDIGPLPAEERKQSCKRKRTPVETESEDDLDIGGKDLIQIQRRHNSNLKPVSLTQIKN